MTFELRLSAARERDRVTSQARLELRQALRAERSREHHEALVASVFGLGTDPYSKHHAHGAITASVTPPTNQVEYPATGTNPIYRYSIQEMRSALVASGMDAHDARDLVNFATT